jgi:hypothetical protein
MAKPRGNSTRRSEDPLWVPLAAASVSRVCIDHKARTHKRQKVMLSHDLAQLYGVETRTLTQDVKRNIDRFPNDFMFQLNDEEQECLRSQIVILKRRPRPTPIVPALHLHRARRRHASSVLRSEFRGASFEVRAASCELRVLGLVLIIWGLGRRVERRLARLALGCAWLRVRRSRVR